MTKKRFIKLLMSKGESRNKARQIARAFNYCHKPYKKAYSQYLFEVSLKKSFGRLGDAARKAAESISKCAQSFKKFTEVIKNETK